MKTLMLAFSFLLVSFLPSSVNAETKAADSVVAVAFHADWCPGCKILGPKMKEVRSGGELDKANILFVKLNFTDKVTTHQSKLHAEALGLGEMFKKNAGKTGFVLLVDPKTHEVVDKIDYKMDVEEIAKKLKMKTM